MKLVLNAATTYPGLERNNLKLFSGFLSKAKKKLLNEDEPDNVTQREFDGSGLEYEPNNPWNWDPPPLGK